MKIIFEEIVADFIRDETGILWFIGVRAFKIKQNGIPYLGHFRAEF